MASADDTLLQRARGGDRAALVELLRRHEAAVRQAIERRLPQKWQALLSADDVLQQTFAEAISAIRRFTPHSDHAFAAWLKKLGEHHVIEAVRALEAEKRGGNRNRIQAAAGADGFTVLLERLTGIRSQTTPSQMLMRGEARESMRWALDRLPEHYRLVVQRYDLEGRSIDEVAAEMQRSPGAVHLLRVRAHARLRELLE